MHEDPNRFGCGAIGASLPEQGSRDRMIWKPERPDVVAEYRDERSESHTHMLGPGSNPLSDCSYSHA